MEHRIADMPANGWLGWQGKMTQGRNALSCGIKSTMLQSTVLFLCPNEVIYEPT